MLCFEFAGLDCDDAGAYTTPIAHDASAAQMTAALEALDNIGDVSVSRDAATAQGGHVWRVTFDGNPGDQPLLSVKSVALTGVAATASVVASQDGTTSAETQIVETRADSFIDPSTSPTFTLKQASLPSTPLI